MSAIPVSDQNTKTYKYRRRLSYLRDDLNAHKATWRTILETILPYKVAYLDDDKTGNDGSRKDSKIINNVTTKALRTLTAGMQSGLTPPSRPWFALTLADKDLAEYAPVKEWLYYVKEYLLYIMGRSGFYLSAQQIYRNLAVVGTAPMMILEDFKRIARCRALTAGEYMIAQNAAGQVDTLYREFMMTAYQIVEQFGELKISDPVKYAFDRGSEAKFKIVHAIQPLQGGQYESVYFEEGGNPDVILMQGRYKNQAFVVPRWDVEGTDVYGFGPGHDVIGDSKQLQKMEDKKLRALDKWYDPPVNVPSSFRNREEVLTIAGGINYYDPASGKDAIFPMHQLNPDWGGMREEIASVEQRIKECLYTTLFETALNESKVMTAYELARKHEESLIQLGPMTERVQMEFLDPVIIRYFSLAQDFGAIPPAPRELQGAPINIEYVSLFAQAQKAIGSSAIERTASFVGAMAAVSPEVVDKFDADEAVDQFAEMIGTPPKIIRPDDNVAGIRANRAQLQQAAQMAENAPQMAKGAKDLADTKTGQGSVLDRLIAQMGVQG